MGDQLHLAVCVGSIASKARKASSAWILVVVAKLISMTVVAAPQRDRTKLRLGR